jgi:arylsulfatase A-like enzyme
MPLDTQKKPNFIVFITDQHRADHLGCYGNPIVRTPVIDRLADQGWLFDEFHVATPICMPNRASIMTGRLPSRHGVRHNGIELSHDERTLPQHLQEAGYATLHVGKSHLQNIETKPGQYPREGEVRRAPAARREGPGEHGQEMWKRWEDEPDWDIATPYYGFDTVDLCIHHADDEYGHWRRWIRTRHANADALIGPENATPAPEYELTRCRQAWRTRVPEEDYPTAWIADRAIDRLREVAQGDKPFFLHCSFPDPHHPYTPPGRYWSMYSPDEVPAPPSFHAEHRNLPPSVQWLRDQREAGTAVKNTQALFACTEREAREAIALNYGSISFIDDSIGRVLAELQRLGLDENTVVIFTADHGDYMGDHQMLLKGPVHYRGLIRIPFIWHDPMRPSAGVSAALTQSIDIAPTILDRAGIVEWNGVQGRSLLPLMAGDEATRTRASRTDLLIEEEGQRYYMGFPTRVRMRTLRDARYRLSVYDGVAWGELYDLESDPLETHNLWDEPSAAGVRASMTERMARAMIDMAETSPYPDRIA